MSDASVVVDMFLGPGGAAGDRLERMLSQREMIAAPHLLDAEVAQAFRRLVLRGQMTTDRAQLSIEELAALPILRFAHTRLLSRAFELHQNVTAYDALYLALAEALDAPFLTCDSGLRDVPGCSATVEVLPAP